MNIYILNIGNATATSGVDRYLNVLLQEVKSYPEKIRIYKIELMRDSTLLFHEQKEKEGYTEILIPFPLDYYEIINERYWIRKYNQYVFQLISSIFDKNTLSVLHLHTLNLIDLALYIKSQVPCKIITHLHCIPWKDLFNTNKKKFNTLYSESYLHRKKRFEKDYFLTNNCEYDSYFEADKIIAVTRCAKKFLVQTMKVTPSKIAIISNGLYDNRDNSDYKRQSKISKNTFNCLYVGVLSESKGIFYILEALQIIYSKGYHVSFNIAGSYSSDMKKKISSNYPDLSINLLGRIPFKELKEQYLNNDLGVIASLQEQCSYAAIEMAMFGLPIVTTAVDGLDEMFTDNVNALKVNTQFSKIFGLKVDTDMLVEKIISLIEDESLRNKLSKNVRKLYEKKFTSKRMLEETITVYKELMYE